MFIVVLLTLTVIIPNPTATQYTVFKTVLAVSVAGIGGVVAGFIHVEGKVRKLTVRAGGALALFVLVYFFNPAAPAPLPEANASQQADNANAKAALATLAKQLKQVNTDSNSKSDIIKDQQALIATLLAEKTKAAKPLHSARPDRAATVDEALAAIAANDPSKADKILSELIAAEQPAVAKTASLYRQQGALWFATNTNKALAAYQRATGLEPDNASGWNRLGHLYRRVGQLPKALATYQRVEAIGKQQQDKGIEATALGNMGIVYQTRGELDKALGMYQQALEINQSLGRQEGMANNYGNMGVVYEIRGELDKAEASWKKSRDLFNNIGASDRAERVQDWLDGLKRQGSLKPLQKRDQTTRISYQPFALTTFLLPDMIWLSNKV